MNSPLAPENVGRAQPWKCKKCDHTNKGHQLDCARCGHEPMLGRRDHENRRWADAHREDET